MIKVGLEIIVDDTADRITAGYSHEEDQWGGTYNHSFSFLDTRVQNVLEQEQSSGLRVQSNLHADWNFRTHVNEFGVMDPDQERKIWIQTLRSGDRIQLYPIAQYFGWRNYVHKAAITIRYDTVTPSGQSLEGSMNESSERPGKPDPLELERQKGSDFQQPGVFVYHQSLHAENGLLTSLRPLVREQTGITAVILGNFNLSLEQQQTTTYTATQRDAGSLTVHLNEYAIDGSDIEDLWDDIEYLQRQQVKVIGMLDMSQGIDDHDKDVSWVGNFDDPTFERYYSSLRTLLVSKQLDGINLDTGRPGQWTNLDDGTKLSTNVKRLINCLRRDFERDVMIVITTPADALLGTKPGQQANGIEFQTLEIGSTARRLLHSPNLCPK